MDTIPTGFYAELIKFGIGGCFIVYLIWCCKKKDDRYDALAKLVNEVQERRSQERADNAKAMAEAANAMLKLAESVQAATADMKLNINVAVETMAAATRAIEARGRR